MIITCKREVPARWILFAILPWASFTFNYAVIATAFLFSLKKFVENPAGVTFILSLPGLLAIVACPIASFLSDRIWTRVGRRKPFIIASWSGMLAGMVLMPLMPNFWLLLTSYLLFNVASDLNTPMEPLKQEIIPPHERGRATGAMTWLSNLATMVFYFVMLGRFDDVSFLAGMPIDGEAVIYWSGALLLGVLLFLIMLGIRETDPKSSLRGQRLTVRNFVGGLLDRELWPVYLLVFGNACLNFYAGLGALSNLLYTDQWGYTKQEMGINVAIGGIVNLFIIGALTVFADRLNRMRAYQTMLCLSLLGNIFYYCYVEFVLPDQRPSLVEIIVFGESLSVLSILAGLLYVPLVYDYVRRNRMGTYGAGASIVDRICRLITLNGVGLFVTYYALAFQPPAGEMTRVVLRDEHRKPELLTLLKAATWPLPAGAAPVITAGLAANIWQADGVTGQQGRTWEIRQRDKESESLAKQKDNLEAERSPLLSKEALARDAAVMDRKKGNLPEAGEEEQTRQTYQTKIADITKRIETINVELSRRADKFREQVTEVLTRRMIEEGDQILGARMRPAIILGVATSDQPDPSRIEKILEDLRKENASIIDLRPVRRDAGGYGVALSAFAGPAGEQAAYVNRLQALFRQTAMKHHFPLGDAAPFTVRNVPAITLDLLVAEEPVDRYASPITRAVNSVLKVFGRAPSPLRRLTALARNLRLPVETNHVLALPGSSARTISVTAVLQPGAPGASHGDAIDRKLAALLAPRGAGVGQVRAFYDRIEKMSALQRITVAHPILTSGYAPLRYDYMSGYLWMFVMGTVGIMLTFLFGKLEKKGIVQKRGVEEALAS